MLLCYITLELIGSATIDIETYPWVLLQIVCGVYPNQTCGFAFPVGLRNVVARVTFGYAYLASVLHEYNSTRLNGLIPAQMMTYNFH